MHIIVNNDNTSRVIEYYSKIVLQDIVFSIYTSFLCITTDYGRYLLLTIVIACMDGVDLFLLSPSAAALDLYYLFIVINTSSYSILLITLL